MMGRRLRLNAEIFFLFSIPLAFLPTIQSTWWSFDGSFHKSGLALRKFLLSPENYSTEIPPIASIGDVVNVTGRFSLMEIASLDEVKEELVTSGFFHFTWKDQIRSWNSSDFGGISYLEMEAKNVWLPSLQIMNAVESRNPFQGQDSYLEISSDGETSWHPSGILHTSCDLSMFKYPFDTQTCEQQICPTYNNGTTLQLILEEDIDMVSYKTNSNWEILRSKLVNEKRSASGSNTFSCINIHLEVRRVNTAVAFVLIFALMSLPILNVFVFEIPLETGENMSYAVTVVLAMIVLQGTVNAMLPQVFDLNPLFQFYSVANVSISLFTVLSVIWVGHLHHKYEVKGGEVDLNGSRSKHLKPFHVRMIAFLIKVTLSNSNPAATASRSKEMSDYGATGHDEEGEGSGDEVIEGENFLERATRTGCYEGLSMNVNKTLFRLFGFLTLISSFVFVTWLLALLMMYSYAV